MYKRRIFVRNKTSSNINEPNQNRNGTERNNYTAIDYTPYDEENLKKVVTINDKSNQFYQW